jgi:hypothetical protein
MASNFLDISLDSFSSEEIVKEVKENTLVQLSLAAFLRHKELKLIVFSYLTGADLYHKIALLNKSTRESLPKSGLLD